MAAGAGGRELPAPSTMVVFALGVMRLARVSTTSRLLLRCLWCAEVGDGIGDAVGLLGLLVAVRCEVRLFLLRHCATSLRKAASGAATTSKHTVLIDNI